MFHNWSYRNIQSCFVSNNKKRVNINPGSTIAKGLAWNGSRPKKCLIFADFFNIHIPTKVSFSGDSDLKMR